MYIYGLCFVLALCGLSYFWQSFNLTTSLGLCMACHAFGFYLLSVTQTQQILYISFAFVFMANSYLNIIAAITI